MSILHKSFLAAVLCAAISLPAIAADSPAVKALEDYFEFSEYGGATILPADRMVLLYCNAGTLSAQAGLGLRVAGMDNVRILQGGFDEWKAKGGFDANRRALKNSKKGD
jgi:rhodanese-related sulfurtransferase